MLAPLQNLLQCIALEEKAQQEKYNLNEQHTLKQLKAEGLALHPLQVTNKSFGFADYPEVSFRLAFPPEQNAFRGGAAIELFCAGEEAVKGVLLELSENKGLVRLHAPDWPDWIEEKGIGIKLAPDTHTTQVMRNAIKQIDQQPLQLKFFNAIYGIENKLEQAEPLSNLVTLNNLNESQKIAVQKVMANNSICIVHGPPGTGKTTTLLAAVEQLVKQGKKIVVAAPSNAAVDYFAKKLIEKGIAILRVGNTSKVNEAVFAHTPEGRLQNNAQQLKEIKQLKQQAEAFRKMALSYKRQFGKAEREQRNLLFKEVKSIRTSIAKIQDYNEEKLYAEAEVILGTPVGLHDSKAKQQQIDTLFIDEAGQCLEPLAWTIFPLATKIVLAGDHLQLPPTVLSDEAMQKGFNQSILERCVAHLSNITLLDTQYRMRASIAGFSSAYFYKGLLQTPIHLLDVEPNITFIDTAGTGFEEKSTDTGVGLQNEGEVKLVQNIIEEQGYLPSDTVIISPYNGQVALLKTLLSNFTVSTIDSFQGQEKAHVIISLVRSNDDQVIGFLKDYRRMNVAITRAKEKLYIIGDSSTIAQDHFFKELLAYIESNGRYKSAWEFSSLFDS